MSAYLHSLGRWCARRAPRVLAAWLLLIAILGGAVSAVGMRLTDTFTISGTESMKGLEVLDERLPQAAGTSEQVLFTASDGDIGGHADAVNTFASRAADIDGVAMVSAPFGDAQTGTSSTVSADGAHALVQVQADTSVGSVLTGNTPRAAEVARDLEDLADQAHADDPAVDVQLGGNIGQKVGIGISGTELVGVVIAAVVLLVTFGSVLAAGAPLVAASLGVGTGMLGILLAAAATDINSTTPVLAVMIGLAVGIDYALFIISRAREYLADGVAPAEAAGRAAATAGSAVVFAGTTVVVALCGLSVAGIGFLTTMGVASAAVVAVAVLVALTAVPALIGLIGKRLAPRGSSRRGRQASRADAAAGSVGAGAAAGSGSAAHAVEGAGEAASAGTAKPGTPVKAGPATRWVRAVTRRPWLTIGAVVLLLGITAIPISGLHLALTDNGFAVKGTQQRQTYDAIAEAYGEGYNSPIIVIADIANTTDPVGTVNRLSRDIAGLDGVSAVALATPNQDGTLAFIQIRPERSQADPATMDLVRDIRSRADGYEHDYGISDVMVTGQAAVAIDVAESLNASLLPFGIVVVGLSLILLTVVFRSVAVPLTATLGYLLSLAAGMGAVGAVFGWGWAADLLQVSKVGAVISFLPVIVMGVLFGLAMDYEVFLVSRMREEWIRRRPAGGPAGSADTPTDPAMRRRAAVEAVEAGFAGSAKVVGAAAVIMAGVFAAFIHTENVYIKPIAVGLTVGILADAFVVRMTLVPALMAALGERAWWLPPFLERQLPVIDVEGEGLERTLEHEAWTAAHGPAVLRAQDLVLADDEGTALRGLTLALGGGQVALVRAAEPLTRRALAAAIGGRLQPAGGVLAVADHVLPDGTAAIQSVTTAIHAYDDPVPSHVRIVVVDDPGHRRWKRVAELASRGVAVVVTADTATAEERPEVAVDAVIDIDADGAAHVRRAPIRRGRGPAPATAGERPEGPDGPGSPGTSSTSDTSDKTSEAIA
ncbi:MMPL family transporter [Actinomyces israelii]|uniref:MMPL family transporter n=1 Tax=Actinomyces israelii TaxID=1659 RepID=A0ABT4IAL4_9ACTO|nr:MMPL family transporter [Actinomyces israelii]MCZ0858771.1 MMPL family transporter [Actinomyces israelii]